MQSTGVLEFLGVIGDGVDTNFEQTHGFEFSLLSCLQILGRFLGIFFGGLGFDRDNSLLLDCDLASHCSRFTDAKFFLENSFLLGSNFLGPSFLRALFFMQNRWLYVYSTTYEMMQIVPTGVHA